MSISDIYKEFNDSRLRVKARVSEGKALAAKNSGSEGSSTFSLLVLAILILSIAQSNIAFNMVDFIFIVKISAYSLFLPIFIISTKRPFLLILSIIPGIILGLASLLEYFTQV